MCEYQPTRNSQFIGGRLKTKEEAKVVIKEDQRRSRECVEDGWLTQEQHDQTEWYILKIRTK